jgi:hypothetical protein
VAGLDLLSARRRGWDVRGVAGLTLLIARRRGWDVRRRGWPSSPHCQEAWLGREGAWLV